MNGIPSHPAEPARTTCAQTGGSLCNGSTPAPACVVCLLATDCPGTDTDCHRRICGTQNTCGFANEPAGTSAGPTPPATAARPYATTPAAVIVRRPTTPTFPPTTATPAPTTSAPAARRRTRRSPTERPAPGQRRKVVQRRRLRAVPRQGGLRRDGHALPPVRLPGRPHLRPHRRPGRNGGGHRRDRQLPQVGLRWRGRRHVRRRRHGQAGRRQFVHRRRLHERHPDRTRTSRPDAGHELPRRRRSKVCDATRRLQPDHVPRRARRNGQRRARPTRRRPCSSRSEELDGTLVGTVPLPQGPVGTQTALTMSGSATSEGALSLSGRRALPDTRWLRDRRRDEQRRRRPRPRRSIASRDVSTSRATWTPRRSSRGDQQQQRAQRGQRPTVRSSGSRARAARRPAASGTTRSARTGGEMRVVSTPNNVRVLGIFGNQLFGSSDSGAVQQRLHDRLRHADIGGSDGDRAARPAHDAAGARSRTRCST